MRNLFNKWVLWGIEMQSNRSNIFGREIDQLELDTWQKRLMQAGIALTAFALPVAALITPNQTTTSKLLELGLGSAFGAASAVVCKAREDIEKRYASFLELRKEHEKGSIKQEYAFHAATQVMKGELNLSGAVNQLQIPTARARYMEKFQLQGLIAPPPKAQQQTATLDTGTKAIPITTVQPAKLTSDISWLLQIAAELTNPVLSDRKHHHFIIHGGSQTGKSTLVSALIILSSHLLAKQGTPTAVNLIDPKYPESEWMFEPGFKDYNEVLPGLQDTFSKLQELKAEAKKQGKSLSADNGFLFTVVDEQDNIYGNGQGYPDKIDKTEVKSIINIEKALIKEGAAYNFCEIIIGQSPLNADSGFNRQIYKSCTHIVLGDAALSWVKDASFPYTEYAQKLTTEILKFQRAKERFGLIMPKGGVPFIVRMSPEIRQIIEYEKSKNNRPHPEEINEEDPEGIDDESEEIDEEDEPKAQPKTVSPTNLLLAISAWYFGVFEEHGHYPNDLTLAQAWFELTGEKLSEKGLDYLRSRIHEKE